MAEQYSSTATQLLPEACTNNIVPPTFAGIATLVANPNGSLLAGWLAATDPNAPITYEVYVKKGTATGLFSVQPLITKQLLMNIFALADGSILESALYFVGVRARDFPGNLDSNIVSLSAVSVGVLDSSLAAAVQAMKAVAQSVGGDIIGETDENELVGVVDANEELVGIADCEV